MVAAYCAPGADGQILDQVPRAVRHATELDFEAGLGESRCGVVVCAEGFDPLFYDWLACVVWEFRALPVVCVAPFTCVVARALAIAGPADVVWAHECEETLERCISDLAGPTACGVLQRFRAAFDPQTLTGRTLSLLCDPRRRSGFSIGGLAAQLHVSESTLFRAVRTELGARPKELIDWVVLMRAMANIEKGERRMSIAFALGLHERTLDRISVRLTGRTLAMNGTSAGRTLIISDFLRWANDAMPGAELRVHSTRDRVSKARCS